MSNVYCCLERSKEVLKLQYEPTVLMKFNKLTLRADDLARLGLPDVPYEVPSAYFKHHGLDPSAPPLAAMLFALQQRAADGNADWLKLKPAMDALVLALQKSGWVGTSTINGPNFTIELDQIDLDSYCIGVHRRGRIVAVLAEAGEGRVKAQLFHPPCERTIETLIAFSYNADENGKLPYFGTPWQSAEDTAASNSQYYAAEAGRTYLAPWHYGVGLGWDKAPMAEWIAAREQMRPWPVDPASAAIAIDAYVQIRDLLESLPKEDWAEETLPEFYALPAAVKEEPETEPLTPLSAYNLSQPDGRFAFLWALFDDYQEDGLLMAVNHVWDCLDKPRGLRCAIMAQKVGKTGTGRRALLRFLSRFLEETLHEFEIPDLPDRNAYISFEDWNAACLAHFERVEMRLTAITARYEAILDGREPHDVLPAPTGIVIKGPWGRPGT